MKKRTCFLFVIFFWYLDYFFSFYLSSWWDLGVSIILTRIWFRLSICHRLNLFYKVFINLRRVNFLIIFQMYSNRLVKVLLYFLISISFRFDLVNIRKWYLIKWAFIYLNLIFCSWLFILCEFFLRVVNIWRWIWLH